MASNFSLLRPVCGTIEADDFVKQLLVFGLFEERDYLENVLEHTEPVLPHEEVGFHLPRQLEADRYVHD